MKIYKIAKKSHFEVLKGNKVPLTDEEREICLKAKAVWHHGINGEETPAVWKSKNSKGEVEYVTNTHRAYQTASTLKGVIKKYHDFIKSTASENNKMIKLAFTPDQNKRKIDKNEKDLKDFKRDFKKLETEVKKINRIIEALNIGNRRYWQEKTSFTSLHRKLERLEKLEQEWKKFKSGIDADIKRQIERGTRARIQQLAPTK